MRLLPAHFSVVTATALASIVAVAVWTGISRNCVPCAWMMASGPMAIIGIAEGWYETVVLEGEVNRPAIWAAGSTVSLLLLSMIFSHSYKKHVVTVLLAIIGTLMWLLLAMAITATGQLQ